MALSPFGNIGSVYRDKITITNLGVDQIFRGDIGFGAPIVADPHLYHTFFDDFEQYDATATVGKWALTADAGGTVAVVDTKGGVLSNATDGDDNDESYVSSIAENYLFEANKKLWFEARVKFTEAATDDANIIVGLSDTVGANTLLDNGAGPAASYDGAVFFKVDGGTTWNFETSNATTQNTGSSLVTRNSGSWERLGFFYNANATTGIITPYINGLSYASQALTVSGLAEMHILLGAKAGGLNAETLLIDYVKIIQER